MRNHCTAAIVVLGAIASGCANYQAPAPLIGGFMSPQRSRTACVDAVARYYKVPIEGVKALGDVGTMKDDIYIVTLSPGGGLPNAACTVDTNGAVSEVIRAR
ncbi:hypothetical protein QTI66_16050 [Variovorax sp. J22R133]|uniref:hypothetical protein n=1 Tax=Variovorax brevis TaxID=3053503 RepID=UPI00257530C1|nr:hypothetical protein [Variovorax sp. J22R133]MDM0113672.1 hypothetical protein [Variovorax sp. J22R133]